MAGLKLKFNKTKLVKIGFGFSLVLFTILSYFYCSGLNGVRKFENLLYIDELCNVSSTESYLHASVDYSSGDKESDYNEALAAQHSTQSYWSSYSAYCVVGENETKHFETNSDVEGLSTVSLASVYAWNDKISMEMIKIPLYKNLGYVIRKVPSGYCCYISSQTAREIIEADIGYDDFDDIVDNAFSFEFYNDLSESFVKMTVVNIFLTDNNDGYWSEDDYSSFYSDWNGFNEYFGRINGDMIFTYAPSLFNQYGTTLNFDVRTNYGNVRNALSNIYGLGENYRSKGKFVNLSMFSNNEIVELDELCNFNDYYWSDNILYGGNHFLLIPLCALLIAFIYLGFKLGRTTLFATKAKRLAWSVFYSSFAFLITGLVSVVSLGFSKTLTLLIVFNIGGTILALFAAILGFLVLYLSGKEVRSNEISKN